MKTLRMKYDARNDVPFDAPLSIKLRGEFEAKVVDQTYRDLLDRYWADTPWRPKGDKAKTEAKVGAWLSYYSAQQLPLPVYVAACARMLLGLDPLNIDDLGKKGGLTKKQERRFYELVRVFVVEKRKGKTPSLSECDKLTGYQIPHDTMKKWLASKTFKLACAGYWMRLERAASQN